jgi:succinate dehydrogenase/fumarate reductase flavoprotein subunit
MDVTYGPELRFVAPPGKPFQQLLPNGRLAARVMGAAFRLLPKRLEAALVKRLLVTWQHPEDRLFADGAILVNADGRRFVDELRSPDREVAAADQPGKVAYLLLDGRLVERYSTWPHFISTAPDIAYAYVADYQRLRPDVTAVGPDLAAVAVVRGLDPGRLAATVEEYNRQLGAGVPDPFGRAAGGPPLGPGPWALLGPVKAYFTTTEGGVRVTPRLEVVGADGRPIPGLYAVGQNGLGGMVLWGHGLHIAWALTSGRLAGREVMSGG